jgi:hypothetical protein
MGKKYLVPYLCLAFVALAALVIITCASSEDGSPIASRSYKAIVTPLENPEAAEAAIWLSGELVAPEDLYLTIKADLQAIRAEFGGSISELDIEFVSPWELSVVLIRFTDSGKERLRDGNWPEFFDLNDRFGLSKMDTTRFESSNRAILTFEGRQHPERISEPYDALDDVHYAEPNHLCCDWSNVYPWRLADGMSYLWRSAWGDCMAGCINSRFWYFRVTDSGIEYVGTYELWAEPEPPWWDEAKTAYEYYRGF